MPHICPVLADVGFHGCPLVTLYGQQVLMMVICTLHTQRAEVRGIPHLPKPGRYGAPVIRYGTGGEKCGLEGSGLFKPPEGLRHRFRQRIAILLAEEFVTGAGNGKQLSSCGDKRQGRSQLVDGTGTVAVTAHEERRSLQAREVRGT